jgi:hypothetical protein
MKKNEVKNIFKLSKNNKVIEERVERAINKIDSLFDNGGRVTINDLKEIRKVLRGEE